MGRPSKLLQRILAGLAIPKPPVSPRDTQRVQAPLARAWVRYEVLMAQGAAHQAARALWLGWCESCQRWEALRDTRSQDGSGPDPTLEALRPALPEPCRGLPCGARTRKGTPCKQRDVYRGGRCLFHGGLSTGPRTSEGKARSAQNGHCPKRRKQTPWRG